MWKDELADLLAAVNRSITPLMTNLLPAAVGADGRVNLFVGNVSAFVTDKKC
jgi:hypothetical protein